MLPSFDKNQASSLVKAQETTQFPVNFDEAWQWLEYSTKQKAEQSLARCGFIDGIDFLTSRLESTGGRPAKNINLTVDCFKQWAMMSVAVRKNETASHVVNTS